MSEQKNGFSWKWPAIIVAGLAVIGIGVWFFKRGNDAAPQFQTAAIERGDLTQVVTATGTLNPVVSVVVGCQVSGRIKTLYADFNSQVKSNELIAEIDPRTYEAQVAQAQADLANAKANMELQQANAERDNQLLTNKLIAQADYDTATASLHEATAMVQIKEAALNNAEENLGYCKIYSPVDGMVISNAVSVGQTVAASFSAPTLFQIANDLTRMQIDASVAEADVGGVEEGQMVDFTVDAYPERTFRGAVRQVRNAPAMQNNVVTYDCVISVTNADYKLKPGMTATVSIIVAKREGVLKIPNSALRFRPPEETVANTNLFTSQIAKTNNGNRAAAGDHQGDWRRGGGAGHGEHQLVHTVYVLPANAGKNPKLQAVQIKTGITDGIYTEALGGLNEGDQIVTGATVAQGQSTTSNPFGGGGFPRRF
ncbi:MAG TPA: efflux RND transporter periplasmic adaptor subunit [Methylomirabilota bacterium]|nr:efflux RND transporter periplasmic adaptor subunit [Methylomirabilota bacterium]